MLGLLLKERIKNMNKSDYRKALGFIASYKTLDEPMLFNEMKNRLQGIKLEKRGKSSAAFSVTNYEDVVNEIEAENFVFLGTHSSLYDNKKD